MARFKFENRSVKSNKGVILVTLLFALIGMVLIVIGFKNEILSFLKTFGIIILVLSLIPLVTFLGIVINKKIKEL